MTVLTARGMTLTETRMYDVTQAQIWLQRWMNHPATSTEMKEALKEADDALDLVYGLLQEEA
jgi:hypothetical protein